MGQNQSCRIKSVDLSNLINAGMSPAIKRTMTVNSNCIKNYAITVPINIKDEVIRNISIPDASYKNVMLTVGTHVFYGTLEDDKNWYFHHTIPLFKIPDEPCYLTIFPLADGDDSPVNLCYDSHPNLRFVCRGATITSDGLIYQGGHVV